MFKSNNNRAQQKNRTVSDGMRNNSNKEYNTKNKIGTYSTSYYDDEYEPEDEEDAYDDDNDYNGYE